MNDLEQLGMKAISGRKKDKEDIIVLCNILKKNGISFLDFETMLLQIFNKHPEDLNKSIVRLIKKLLD